MKRATITKKRCIVFLFIVLSILSGYLIITNRIFGRCAKCDSFSQYVQSFENQMKESGITEQRELLRQLHFDPQQSEEYHYRYSVHTLQKNTNTDIYTVELTFHSPCHDPNCFSDNKTKTITLNIKGKDNYYSLFYE